MNEETWFRWISVLGFPIVSAVAMAFALYKVGTFLVTVHAESIKENTIEMKKQTSTLRDIKSDLAKVCKANCPTELNCDNFKRPGLSRDAT